MSVYVKLQEQLELSEDVLFSFAFTDNKISVSIQCYRNYPTSHAQTLISCRYLNHHKATIQEILTIVADEQKSQPDLLSLSVRMKGAKISNAKMKTLLMGAICDVYHIPYPDTAQLKKMRQEKLSQQKKLRETHIELLKQANIESFNAISPQEKKNAVHYRKTNLSAAKMSKVSFVDLDFRDSIFDDVDLTGANLKRIQFKGASFKNAILNNANLRCCNLQGADFSGATLNNANLQFSSYDNNTLFPDDFIPHQNMDWKGTGSSPAIDKRRAVRDKAITGMTIDGFMQSLGQNVETARLDKALKMLKKSSFELYTQVDDEGVIGVIKSQSDPDLIYSCRLTSKGKFSCCTQNLNTCGGLRGKLCKHLLVLAVGLVQNQKIDAKTIYQWVDNSHDCKPELDREAMSEVLLRYKGAEAGEIDWRPTETVPEDYYLF